MKYIILILFAVFFMPFKIEIYLEANSIDKNKEYIKVSIFKIPIIKLNIKEKVEDILSVDKVITYQVKMLRYISIKDIKKILKRIKYKEIRAIYGIGTEDYINKALLNVSLITTINMIIGYNYEKLKKTKISIKNIETKYSYTYKINCIFTTNIANNIFVIKNYIEFKIKERWNLKWQNIQLKV